MISITNNQAPNNKQYPNSNSQNPKHYDLEERTYKFAKDCRDLVKEIPKTISNIEYGKQLVRSSGSQAANYIEANESLSQKDFCHRIKISRKEAKESRLWLRLIVINESQKLETERERLIHECEELKSIFSAILNKSV